MRGNYSIYLSCFHPKVDDFQIHKLLELVSKLCFMFQNLFSDLIYGWRFYYKLKYLSTWGLWGLRGNWPVTGLSRLYPETLILGLVYFTGSLILGNIWISGFDLESWIMTTGLIYDCLILFCVLRLIMRLSYWIGDTFQVETHLKVRVQWEWC